MDVINIVIFIQMLPLQIFLSHWVLQGFLFLISTLFV